MFQNDVVKDLKVLKLLIMLLLIAVTISSCRLGKHMSEADPETEAEADTLNVNEEVPEELQ